MRIITIGVDYKAPTVHKLWRMAGKPIQIMIKQLQPSIVTYEGVVGVAKQD